MSPKHAAMIKALELCAFAVESVAHLQGRERELLPFSDQARDAIAQVRELVAAAAEAAPADAGPWSYMAKLSASENHKGFAIREETKRGEILVRVLGLREAKQETAQGRLSFDPVRYGTEGGTKTALGVFRTVKRIIEEGK